MSVLNYSCRKTTQHAIASGHSCGMSWTRHYQMIVVQDSTTPSRFVDVTPKSPINTQTEASAVRDESSKTVITEDDVRGLENGAILRIAETARLTALAADLVSEKGIEIVRRVPRRGSKSVRMVAIGADHGGFKMKEDLKAFLTELGQQVHDFGTNSEDAVDYPDFAYAVAKSVSEGKPMLAS